MNADSAAPPILQVIMQRYEALIEKIRAMGLGDPELLSGTPPKSGFLDGLTSSLPELVQEITELHAMMRYAERTGPSDGLDFHSLRKGFGDTAGTLVRLMLYKRAPDWSFSPVGREHTQALEAALGAFTGAAFGSHEADFVLPQDLSPDMEMARNVAITLQALRDCLACGDLESTRELAVRAQRILGSLAIVPLQPSAGRRLVDAIRVLMKEGVLRKSGSATAVVLNIQRDWPGLIRDDDVRAKCKMVRHLLHVEGLKELCAEPFDGMLEAHNDLKGVRTPAEQALATRKLVYQADRLAREIAVQSLVIAGMPVKQAREVYRARDAGAYVRRGRDRKKT